jgi:hypothetical protein
VRKIALQAKRPSCRHIRQDRKRTTPVLDEHNALKALQQETANNNNGPAVVHQVVGEYTRVMLDTVITKKARAAAEYDLGMADRKGADNALSDVQGNMTYGLPANQRFLRTMAGMEERDYSDQTAQVIDEEVRKLIDTSYNHVKNVLQENRSAHRKRNAGQGGPKSLAGTSSYCQGQSD